jgi:hypothetical protein
LLRDPSWLVSRIRLAIRQERRAVCPFRLPAQRCG